MTLCADVIDQEFIIIIKGEMNSCLDYVRDSPYTGV